MKAKYHFFLFVTILVALCTGCGEKLTTDKCEELILAHPFFSKKHISLSKTKLDGCEDAYAGCVKNGYVNLGNVRDRLSDAYYYYLNGFDIKDVHNLVIEENRATCEFSLIETDKTSAYEIINDHRIEKKGRTSMPCTASFTKYEDGGWKLDAIECDGLHINIWQDNDIVPYVNFDSFE